MQSGKSGTYLRVALECIHRGFFKKAYIICGSRDVALREQTKTSLTAAIETFVGEKSSSFAEGMSLMRILESNIKVFWNQDLKGVEIGSDCLIINDESHVAQSKGNIPYKQFWQKNGMENCLYGDFKSLRERNIRVLSVSATSFSECVQNQKVVLGVEAEQDVALSTKNVFIMNPGPSYTGIGNFLRNGNIHFTSEQISEKTGGEHLKRIIKDPKYNNKYCPWRQNY
jgi:hypothetical protein